MSSVKRRGGISEIVTLLNKLTYLVKLMTMGGGGVKNLEKMSDIICGRPHMR